MKRERTQVGIAGAGPAGLLLGHLLDRAGIDSVILENRCEEYVVERVRAGVLEQGTADLMIETGAGDRLLREGMRHDGVYIAFGGTRRRIDFQELTGKSIWVYGQNEVVRDLIEARRKSGRPLYFESADVRIDAERRMVSCADREIKCDFIAGCDGFHGICRASIHGTAFERVYPFAWLGILAHAAPSSHELVYSLTERGFALFSMRTEKVTRLYLQCAPDEIIENWPDERIWRELKARLSTSDGWGPNEGEIFQKGITPMRSFVLEPMQHGRLFLAGDAAHIVPPTGAKGLNLAAADVRVLANALQRFYESGDESGLAAYTETCLKRVWRAQRFSWWMTSMLHLGQPFSGFDYRRQLAELDYVTSSRAAMTSLAENYVGWE